jgi:hypothetical protein
VVDFVDAERLPEKTAAGMVKDGKVVVTLRVLLLGLPVRAA